MPRVKKYDPDRVLEKAMKTFWAKGYDSTSVENLVESMGINRFSLYDSFGSKRQLYLSVLDTYCQNVVGQRLGALEGSDEGLDCLRKFLNDYADGVCENVRKKGMPKGCLMTMTSTDLIREDPEVARRVEANLRRMIRAFRRVLERAVEKGEINRNADLNAYAIYLVGCAQGLDIIAKSLNPKELRIYIDKVIAGLQ